MATSDHEEVVQLADRALVMVRGRIVGELSGDQVTANEIVAAAGGAPERRPVRTESGYGRADWRRQPSPCRRPASPSSLPKVTASGRGPAIAEIVTFSILAPAFLTRANFLNVLTAIAVPGSWRCRHVLIIAGQFDLSVASIIALTGVAMATAAEGHSLSLAIIVALAVGVSAGLVNGFLVTVVGVNALITTLGMLAVLSGLARVIADGLSVPVHGFSTLGTHVRWGYTSGHHFLAVFLIFSFLGRFTTFGRSVYAIGSNPSAARLPASGPGR